MAAGRALTGRGAEAPGDGGFRLRATPGGAVLAIYAGILVLASMSFTWWRMENRAPQYGMRVLVVNVSPRGVEGDVKEIDGLGHYVGMKKLETMAALERRAAPFAIPLLALCAFALPFLRPGRLRTVLGSLVILVPVGFVLDMWFWQQYAVTHLDPKAALSMIADRVEARLIGDYTVAQFKVYAAFGIGFWLAVVAAANVAAFLAVERRPSEKTGARRQAGPNLAAAVLVVGLLTVTGTAAEAATLEVGPAATYRTIGAAVAAAEPGDRVVVRAGVYREHIVIDRPLELTASGDVTIDGGGAGTLLEVTAGSTVVSGFHLQGSGSSLLAEDAALKLLGAPGCRISNNKVTDALFGILAKNSDRVAITWNHVAGKDIEMPRRGDGIRLHNSSHSVVDDNVVEQSRDFVIWQSNGCSARRNTVTGCRYGLHYMYCDDNTFEDNVFSGNQTGAAIMYSRRLILRGNRFTGSRGPSAHGLLIKVGDDVVVENNWFLDNSAGLFLEDTPSSLHSGCTFRNNVIGGNDIGISLQPSVARLVFTGNVLVSNRLQVEMLGTVLKEQNEWSTGGRGNYWSDYVGFDADQDGLGDTPYKLEQFFENLTDRWPAVGLLRMSPATLALETAARAFPVGEPRPTVTDPHPLIEPPSGLASPLQPDSDPLMATAGGALVLAAGIVLFRVRGPEGGVS